MASSSLHPLSLRLLQRSSPLPLPFPLPLPAPSRPLSLSFNAKSTPRSLPRGAEFRTTATCADSGSSRSNVAAVNAEEETSPFRAPPWQAAAAAFAGLAWSALLLMGPPAALAEDESSNITITFPASPIPEVSRVQKTLVEAWGIVEETYWDSTFNNQDWEEQLRKGLSETVFLQSADEAYSKIRGMLATLGDPFTRIVPPQEYQNFRISSDGALQGVGLLIGSEPDTGRVFVLSPIEGGPAARAGIQSGDEIVQINDEDLTGLTGEQAATKLRGRAGTSVDLTVKRVSENPFDEAVSSEDQVTHVRIQRETITLSPIFAVMLQHTDNNGNDVQTGYIRLTAFSQNAATDMQKAITRLENAGASGYILDLRNNPGGLVKAGLDVAQIWLDGDETLVNTIDRAGNLQAVNLVHGQALTHQPLVVLVNQGSASASEILAGALRDNGRALLVGENTYGKGKIQSVFELDDGAALFVTVAKYLSPNLKPIDRVGLAPDLRCTVEIPVTATVAPGPASPQPGSSARPLRQAVMAEPNPAAQLQADSCVLTAEQQLQGK